MGEVGPRGRGGVGLGGGCRAAGAGAAARRCTRCCRECAARVSGTSDARADSGRATSCPAFLSRGVVQISAYVDTLIATLLPSGAVAALSYAQNLYVLPVSLFGMSVSAAELPRMSGASGASTDQGRARRAPACTPRGRAAADLVLRDSRPAASSSPWVRWWRQHCSRRAASTAPTASTCGASSPARASGCCPARWAASTRRRSTRSRTRARRCGSRSCACSPGSRLGFLLAVYLPRHFGIEAAWGAPGLALAGSLAGWLEFLLLRRSLSRVVGRTVSDPALLARLWGAAAVAALGGVGRPEAGAPPAADRRVRGRHGVLRGDLRRHHARAGNPRGTRVRGAAASGGRAVRPSARRMGMARGTVARRVRDRMARSAARCRGAIPDARCLPANFRA